MMRNIEMLGYKWHDGRMGWIMGMLGTALLNFAYRENRKLYREMLIDRGIKAARRI
jgi:hypothetical protein